MRWFPLATLALLAACKGDPSQPEAPSGGTPVEPGPPRIGPPAPKVERPRPPTIDAGVVARYEAYLAALAEETRAAKAGFRKAKPEQQPETSGGTAEVRTWAAEVHRREAELNAAARKKAAITADEVEELHALSDHLMLVAQQLPAARQSLEQLRKVPVTTLPPQRQQEVRQVQREAEQRVVQLENAIPVRARFGDAAVVAYRAREAELTRLQQELNKAAAE